MLAPIHLCMRDLRGDITTIPNGRGAAVVTYCCKIPNVGGSMASTLGIQNPFRYRGYVYDQETGLYYLQTCYYDPEPGRFISADDLSYLGAGGELPGCNLFAYCGNNPVNMVDSAGNEAISISVCVVGGVAIMLLTGAYSSTPARQQGIQGFVAYVIDSYNTVKTVAIAVYDKVSSGIASAYVAASKSKDDVDPYRRSGQKKQRRERKNKSRRSEKFKSRNNRRDNMPSPPKHHTPSPDHQKSFSNYDEEK